MLITKGDGGAMMDCFGRDFSVFGKVYDVDARRKGLFAVVALLLTAMLCGLALSGCSASDEQKETIEGKWHFESMSALDSAKKGLDENGLADLEGNENMLAVFMYDAELNFEDGKFSMTFMGADYDGTYELSNDSAVVTMTNDVPSFYVGGTYTIKDGKIHFTPDDEKSRLHDFDVVYAPGEFNMDEAVDAQSENEPANESGDDSASDSSTSDNSNESGDADKE